MHEMNVHLVFASRDYHILTDVITTGSGVITVAPTRKSQECNMFQPIDEC